MGKGRGAPGATYKILYVMWVIYMTHHNETWFLKPYICHTGLGKWC